MDQLSQQLADYHCIWLLHLLSTAANCDGLFTNNSLKCKAKKEARSPVGPNMPEWVS
jgi:hypothetical protein